MTYDMIKSAMEEAGAEMLKVAPFQFLRSLLNFRSGWWWAENKDILGGTARLDK
jgi:hypothetical protein